MKEKMVEFALYKWLNSWLLVCTLSALLRVAPTSAINTPYSGLSWFVHITDVHMSVHQDPSRAKQLEQFCRETLAVLQPQVVLCGGDLTESKSASHLAADQELREWELYQRVVGARWNNVTWLDIRGNHDNLNVLSRNSSHNLFSRYSVQGPKGNLDSYVFPWVSSGGEQFNFVAVDATWEVGMNYPFNFVGYIPKKEQEKLNDLVSKFNPEDINIFFGHYPSSVVTQSTYLRDLVRNGLVYMSGHLHDLMFFNMHNMYAFHDNGALELELVDWKNNREFRLFAVDRGLFSFTDIKFGVWPVVLVTFPKSSQFMVTHKEPLEDMKVQDQVRLLVFSNVSIETVEVSVDDETGRLAHSEPGGPLYTLSWDPKLYSTGLHTITVTVVDQEQKTSVTRQEFTLDPEQARPIDNWFPTLVLHTSFSTAFHVLFALTLVLNILVLCGLRFLFFLAHTGKLSPKVMGLLRRAVKCCLVRKLVLVCSWDRIWLPLLCFVLYMACGPWVLGSLVEGHTGAVFAWGVLVSGQLAHSQVPFIYYFLHFALIHPGIVLVVGHVLDWRSSGVEEEGREGGGKLRSRVTHVSCLASLLFFLGISIFFSLTFWLQFGLLGFVFGPLKTWSYLFYSAILWLAWTVPTSHLTRVQSLLGQKVAKKTDTESESNSILSSL